MPTNYPKNLRYQLPDNSVNYFYITNTNDAGEGSLRQAILDANADGTATATVPHVVIYYNLDRPTINLASELPALNNHINIEGNMITIAGGEGYRAFTVNDGFTVNFFRLILKDGHPTSDGGAIFNKGKLFLEEVTIKSNRVTGSAEGGAIYNAASGNLTIRKSTLSNNEAATAGGAIANYGYTSINTSTLYGNSANLGGAVLNHSTMYLIKCTVTKNHGGGIYHFVTGNILFFSHTLLVGNTGAFDLSANLATDVYGGYNLVGIKDAGINIGGSENISATAEAVFGTNVLADNGGYSQTINLASDSPAIDAGYECVNCGSDQIGNAIVGDQDIGAIEYISITSIFSHLSDDVINIYSNPGNGVFELELSAAIQGKISWKVIDQNGRILTSMESFNKGNGIEVKTLDLSKQPTGNYRLIVFTEKGTVTRALLKV